MIYLKHCLYCLFAKHGITKSSGETAEAMGSCPLHPAAGHVSFCKISLPLTSWFQSIKWEFKLNPISRSLRSYRGIRSIRDNCLPLSLVSEYLFQRDSCNKWKKESKSGACFSQVSHLIYKWLRRQQLQTKVWISLQKSQEMNHTFDPQNAINTKTCCDILNFKPNTQEKNSKGWGCSSVTEYVSRIHEGLGFTRRHY